MLDYLLQANADIRQQRIWVISDLQQAMPSMIEECLRYGVEDIAQLDLGIDQIWYLGDATEGNRSQVVAESVDIQMRLLGQLGVPLRFIMGNHDLDCTRALPAGSKPVLPMWSAVDAHPQWRTTASCEDFYFCEEYGDWLVVFISDHVAADNSWYVNQNEVTCKGDARYPHHAAVWQTLRERLCQWPGRIVIAGHYAYPGGTRGGPANAVHTQLMPFPDSLALTLHGHAHLGDFAYGFEQCYRRLAWVDYHDLVQANVSSLDRTRGSQSRSAVLDLCRDGSLGLFFRDHEDRCWSDAFFSDGKAPRSLSPANKRHHSRRSKNLPEFIEQRIDKEYWLRVDPP